MSNRKLKLVFIGNSIVNGFPHKRSQGFVSLVREKTGFEVINKGANGETTNDIRVRFSHDVIDHKPDYVFIMTGTNDFIYSENTPEGCMANIDQMIETAAAAGIKTILMTPVPVNPAMASVRWMAGAGIDYEWVQHELDRFSELLSENSNAAGIVDSSKAFAEYCKKTPAEEAYHDGIHPSAEGHTIIAEAVTSCLQSILAEDR